MFLGYSSRTPSTKIKSNRSYAGDVHAPSRSVVVPGSLILSIMKGGTVVVDLYGVFVLVDLMDLIVMGGDV